MLEIGQCFPLRLFRRHDVEERLTRAGDRDALTAFYEMGHFARTTEEISCC